MLLLLAIILAIAWILGFTVYHVASGAIHLLLLLAVVAIIVHFVRGARAPVCAHGRDRSRRLSLAPAAIAAASVVSATAALAMTLHVAAADSLASTLCTPLATAAARLVQ